MLVATRLRASYILQAIRLRETLCIATYTAMYKNRIYKQSICPDWTDAF